MVNLQPSTLTLCSEHEIVKFEGKGSTIIPMSGYRLENKGGNPEYL